MSLSELAGGNAVAMCPGSDFLNHQYVFDFKRLNLKRKKEKSLLFYNNQNYLLKPYLHLKGK